MKNEFILVPKTHRKATKFANALTTRFDSASRALVLAIVFQYLLKAERRKGIAGALIELAHELDPKIRNQFA